MTISKKILLALVGGVVMILLLIQLITDRLSPGMDLYNFATFSAIFLGGAAGLMMLAIVVRVLWQGAIDRVWIGRRIYHALLVMLGVLAAIGFSSYDYASPRRVPIGGTYHATYRPPPRLDDGWEVSSPSEQGMDPRAVERVVETLVNDKAFKRIHSLLVARAGQLIVEEYFYDHDHDQLHDLRSATKSITSLLVGIAIDRGFLTGVDMPIATFFPDREAVASSAVSRHQVTIEDLLTMSTGLACNDWDTASPGNENTMYRSADWVEHFLALPASGPGAPRSTYCTGGVVVLGEIVARVSGLALDAFARRFLLDPLGISEARWQKTPLGRVDAGGHLEITSRDMAKLGQLVLDGGLWRGDRIVSEAWITAMTTSHTELRQRALGNPEYGYLWWKVAFEAQGAPTPAIQALGNGGQYITIFPDLDLVVVFTGGNYGHPRMRKPFELLRELILPSVPAQSGMTDQVAVEGIDADDG